MISIDQFKEIELTVGLILSAEPVPNTDKLLRLVVDFGAMGERQIISGIAQKISIDALIGTKVAFVTNLEPRTLRGFESQGMILAASTDEHFSLIGALQDIPQGTRIG